MILAAAKVLPPTQLTIEAGSGRTLARSAGRATSHLAQDRVRVAFPTSEPCSLKYFCRPVRPPFSVPKSYQNGGRLLRAGKYLSACRNEVEDQGSDGRPGRRNKGQLSSVCLCASAILRSPK